MRVRAVLFAALAQRLGVREEWLELPAGAIARDVFRLYAAREPQLGELGKAVILAVNAEFAGPDMVLSEGDEVALLPPMSGGLSGGAPCAIETGLRREPLARAQVGVSDGAHGAVVVFEGVTRANSGRKDEARSVIALEYEAYEAMAERRLAEIANEATERWQLVAIRILHRLGRVAVGEASVQIVVQSAHRAAAFEACRFAIDTLKRSAPIWKKEHYADGAAWADGEFPGNVPG